MKVKISIPKTYEEIEVSIPIFFKRHCSYYAFYSPSTYFKVDSYSGKYSNEYMDDEDNLLTELTIEEREQNKTGGDTFIITEDEFNKKYEGISKLMLQLKNNKQ